MIPEAREVRLRRGDVQVQVVERGDVERPGGRRFGSLVHAILADIELDARIEQIRASTAINGRIFAYGTRNGDAAGPGDALYAGQHIDTTAKDVVVLDDDVAEDQAD